MSSSRATDSLSNQRCNTRRLQVEQLEGRDLLAVAAFSVDLGSKINLLRDIPHEAPTDTVRGEIGFRVQDSGPNQHLGRTHDRPRESGPRHAHVVEKSFDTRRSRLPFFTTFGSKDRHLSAPRTDASQALGRNVPKTIAFREIHESLNTFGLEPRNSDARPTPLTTPSLPRSSTIQPVLLSTPGDESPSLLGDSGVREIRTDPPPTSGGSLADLPRLLRVVSNETPQGPQRSFTQAPAQLTVAFPSSVGNVGAIERELPWTNVEVTDANTQTPPAPSNATDAARFGGFVELRSPNELGFSSSGRDVAEQSNGERSSREDADIVDELFLLDLFSPEADDRLVQEEEGSKTRDVPRGNTEDIAEDDHSPAETADSSISDAVLAAWEASTECGGFIEMDEPNESHIHISETDLSDCGGLTLLGLSKVELRAEPVVGNLTAFEFIDAESLPTHEQRKTDKLRTEDGSESGVSSSNSFTTAVWIASPVAGSILHHRGRRRRPRPAEAGSP